mmetsp:Transcript_139160/g.197052  ORF Transcript_139160/g.197052 Transcript_139160/m.197052 type:complete len:212 (-) Transcript_139160:8-643(-)
MPYRCVEQPPLPRSRIKNMSRWKLFISLAGLVQGLELARDLHRPIGPPANVQRYDSNRVARDNVRLLLLVPDRKGIHTAHLVLRHEVDAILGIQVEQDLTVALGEEAMLAGSASLQSLLQSFVVVDLAVHAQNDVFRLVVQGLISTVRIDNGQSLVGNDCGPLAVDSTPVRSSVSQELCGLNDLLSERTCFLNSKECQDSAHDADRSYRVE